MYKIGDSNIDWCLGRAHQDSTAASKMDTTLTNICWCCTGSSVKFRYCTGVQIVASAATIGMNCDLKTPGRS